MDILKGNVMDPASCSQRDRRYIELALREAYKADGNQKIGAVVVRGGSVMAKSCNNYTHCRHAEVAALSKIWKSERRGTVLFVARVRREIPFGMSKPCPHCWAFIVDSGIKKVVYTTNDGKTIETIYP